ncbi:MAG: binding-protein-dependent transport system inner rane component [Chloroflexi bacterium]|nr:binding-protein-dependent transport system inner rane component [Chloroflexota bacterium]MDB5076426.1 binding-protein-dependent transport system inner rane component [Chloroflexota bacterium]
MNQEPDYVNLDPRVEPVAYALPRNPTTRRTARLMQQIWKYRLAYLFISPAIAVVLIFIGYPVIDSLILSLDRWDGLGKSTFIGLDNYRAMFSNTSGLLDSLRITVIFTACTTLGTATLGFFLAVAIAERVRGWRFFRIVNFIPVLLPMTVVGVLWGMLLDPTNGAVNTVISSLGFSPPLWLASPSTALWTIILVSIWQYTGFPMIVFLAAIEGIPLELYEAARMDGANGWQRLRYITWPLVQGVALVLVMLQVIFGMRTFDVAWAMTQGGPGTATTLLGVKLYQSAFLYSDYGYGSTVAVAMIVIIGTIAFVYLRLVRPLVATT